MTTQGVRGLALAAFGVAALLVAIAQTRAPLLDDEPLGYSLVLASSAVPLLGGLLTGRTVALGVLFAAYVGAWMMRGGLALFSGGGTDDVGPILALVLGLPFAALLTVAGLLLRAALDRWAPAAAVPVVAVTVVVALGVSIAVLQQPPTGPDDDDLRGRGTVGRWCTLRRGMRRPEVARIMGRPRSFRNGRDGALPGSSFVGRDDVWRAGSGFVTVGFNDAQRVVSFSSVELDPPPCHR